MAECVTDLRVKKVNAEEFEEWLEKETDSYPYYDSAKGWDLYVSFLEGYGGYFWESLALKMVKAFKGIVFECCNKFIFDDHLVGTSCKCNGKEVTLTRYLQLPNDCIPYDCDDEVDEEYEEELEDIRAQFEAEYDIPYLVKFSVKEVMACFEIYDVLGKKLKDSALVEATCTDHKISKERFMEFANIYNFEER